MKSVLGYLLLALIVATVIGLSIRLLSKHGPANVPEQTSTPTPASSGTPPLVSGCPQEGHIKSPSSYDAAKITFDNQTDGNLKIFWIDFNGDRKFYSNLKAHSKYDQDTWIGHVWVVTDSSDQCLKLESANSVNQVLVIK